MYHYPNRIPRKKELQLTNQCVFCSSLLSLDCRSARFDPIWLIVILLQVCNNKNQLILLLLTSKVESENFRISCEPAGLHVELFSTLAYEPGRDFMLNEPRQMLPWSNGERDNLLGRCRCFSPLVTSSSVINTLVRVEREQEVRDTRDSRIYR